MPADLVGPDLPGDLTVDLALDLAAADALATTSWSADHAPGMVYGVIAPVNGRPMLVHVLGLGGLCADPDGARPDAGTAFRIASMTKSFTAATVLALRDRGLLRLDDAVEKYLPQVGALLGPGSSQITVEHLLTMTGGLATDDPWGDRMVSMPVADFDDLVQTGAVGRDATVGDRFEYSNTGYSLLGRLVSVVAGQEYAEAVDSVVLSPLRLGRSGFFPEVLSPEHRARGYVMRDGALVEEEWTSYGAYSAMAGLHSSVADLAAVVGWYLDAERASVSAEAMNGDAVATPPGLPAASRREMQRGRVFIGTRQVSTPTGPLTVSRMYGYGLFVEHDLAIGRVVTHSGGLPGFGSNMRWHPASGVGVVALANRTYAPMTQLADQILRLLLEPHAPFVQPLPARTNEAANALMAWCDDPSRDITEWLSDNVELDVPDSSRRAEVAALLGRSGPLSRDATRIDELDGFTGLIRWYTGATGPVRLWLLMSPQRPSLVQQWRLQEWNHPAGGLRLRPLTAAEAHMASAWAGTPAEELTQIAQDGTGFLALAQSVSEEILGVAAIGVAAKAGEGSELGTIAVTLGVREDLRGSGIGEAAAGPLAQFLRRRFPAAERYVITGALETTLFRD